MKKFKYLSLIFLLLVIFKKTFGQDPSFSQFFSSPLNINPALTANINADWRLIANLRDQWIGPASPYVTGTISYDSKFLKGNAPGADENNYIGIGGMLMYDNAMAGVVKSTYGSLNLSYNINLIRTDDIRHRLGLGFGAIYGRRFIDFSRIDFEEQFTGSGFNKNLPTGELALSNMKPYISASAGLLYSYSSEINNLDVGVAAFHLNEPRQTFLEDGNQRLPKRKVAHANFETFLNNSVVLVTNAIYQFQREASYFSVGGGLGYYLNQEEASIINAGVWYWSNNAVVPYVGWVHNNLQIGVTYDLTISKLSQATRKPNTGEISVILRGKKKPSGFIHCPWN